MNATVEDQPVAAKPTTTFYGACQECTAKWFSPAAMDHCPRCSSRAVLLDRETLPWAVSDEPSQDAVHGPEINETGHEDSPEISFCGDTKMANKPNGPVHEFRAGTMKATIWEREQERDGRTFTTHNVTLQKQYFDRQTGEWRDSNCFFPEELPKLRLLIDKAFEFVTIRIVPEPAES